MFVTVCRAQHSLIFEGDVRDGHTKWSHLGRLDKILGSAKVYLQTPMAYITKLFYGCNELRFVIS
jgi:hypothetical protein